MAKHPQKRTRIRLKHQSFDERLLPNTKDNQQKQRELADNIELASRILRKSSNASLDSTQKLRETASDALEFIACYGEPVQQAKALRATQNAPEISSLESLEVISRSGVTWLRDQALTLSASLEKRFRRKTNATVILQDFMENRSLQRCFSYRKVLTGSNLGLLWAALTALLLQFIFLLTIFLVQPTTVTFIASLAPNPNKYLSFAALGLNWWMLGVVINVVCLSIWLFLDPPRMWRICSSISILHVLTPVLIIPPETPDGSPFSMIKKFGLLVISGVIIFGFIKMILCISHGTLLLLLGVAIRGSLPWTRSSRSDVGRMKERCGYRFISLKRGYEVRAVLSELKDDIFEPWLWGPILFVLVLVAAGWLGILQGIGDYLAARLLWFSSDPYHGWYALLLIILGVSLLLQQLEPSWDKFGILEAICDFLKFWLTINVGFAIFGWFFLGEGQSVLDRTLGQGILAWLIVAGIGVGIVYFCWRLLKKPANRIRARLFPKIRDSGVYFDRSKLFDTAKFGELEPFEQESILTSLSHEDSEIGVDEMLDLLDDLHRVVNEEPASSALARLRANYEKKLRLKRDEGTLPSSIYDLE